MHGPVVTKADFYEACERYFPDHEIVFTHSRISDRRFTDCMVGETLVMRYCPPDKYDVPQAIILFIEGGGTATLHAAGRFVDYSQKLS